MNLAVVNEAVTEMNGVEHQFTEEEKNFVVQFAFRSGSKEDTISLIEALADAIAFSSPEAIVLFGGLAKSGDYIMKPIMKSIDDNVLNIYKGKTKLLVSELKDSDAAVLGASALAWELKDIKE